MAKIFGPNRRKDLIPPNLVAFLAGVVLALGVGMIFRKLIDRMEPRTAQTAMRAQTTLQSQTESNRPNVQRTGLATQASEAPSESNATKIKTNKEIASESQQTNPAPSTDTNKPNAIPTEKPSETSPASAERARPPEKPASHAATAQSESQTGETVVDETTGEVDYLAWRKQFKSLEELVRSQGLNNLNVTLTPRYRHQAKGLAITRGQFLDVVSRKVPANLPTRQANQGLILHALSAIDFDSAQFEKVAQDSGAQLEPLCRSNKPQPQLEGIERITVLMSNTPQNFKCLQDWLTSQPKLTLVQEMSLIGFTRGPTFFGSLSSQKKLVSLQMWNPDWLLDNTVGLEETGSEQPARKRALRLANVTRAVGQPSDVRMQIPASFRPLAGPLIEPRDPTPAKPLVIGNFALVPSHMPRGTLMATAFTNPGQDRSKSASVKPPGPGKTKALVLATQGKKLQFMSVTRE